MAEPNIVSALREVLPEDCLLWQAEDRRRYECDGLTAFRELPAVVALPRTEEQVRTVPGACSHLRVPLVAPRRGCRRGWPTFPTSGCGAAARFR